MTDGADDSDLITSASCPESGARGSSAFAASSSSGDARHSLRASAPSAPPEPLDEADVQSLDDVVLGAYSEDENIVTQQLEAMTLEPRWLVQFTPLDRRLMDTSEVISALLDRSIRRDTPVWRGGMDDWAPVGKLDLLSPAATPTLPPQRRSIRPSTLAPLSRARPLEIGLASLAIALSAATITTSMLSIAGVFEAHETSAPTRVQALRAERVVAREADERDPESLARDVAGRPPAPDPERATAVAQ